ncbi:MAG TPA: phosphotriesterase [Candidatus Saccharimonadia bacterium]|nr:phosphotriesterase [Candidatus Saccharimonadia bacterium]
MGEVQTVLGRVPAEALGVTLPHEHTRCVLWQIPNRWDYWQLTGDEDLMTAELARFRAVGGGCLVDVSLDAIGREPARLARLASASGTHIVMGCGWYRQAYYPAEARIGQRTVDDLADELVGEFRDGVRGTGVRPGVVGEIGTDKPWLTGEEERVHRAAARAARRTGMSVTTHAVMSAVGLAQLRIFEEEGLDPARVVVGHADSYPDAAYHAAIVGRGANVEFDFLGMDFTPVERHGEPRLLRLLLDLLEAGHAERILLSQDVCHDSQMAAYGGHGYTYLAETFLPRLQAMGVDDAIVRTLIVDNPRRLLTLAAPEG